MSTHCFRLLINQIFFSKVHCWMSKKTIENCPAMPGRESGGFIELRILLLMDITTGLCSGVSFPYSLWLVCSEVTYTDCQLHNFDRLLHTRGVHNVSMLYNLFIASFNKIFAIPRTSDNCFGTRFNLHSHDKGLLWSVTRHGIEQTVDLSCIHVINYTHF